MTMRMIEPETAPPREDWRCHLENVYSQNGEDGVLAEIFLRIGTTNRWCFEVGAADGKWFSNTRRLIEDGWSAVLIEADSEKFSGLARFAASVEDGRVIAVNEKIEPNGEHSIDAILLRTKVFPQRPDLGVIDVDGDEYYHFLNMLQHRPRVMVVEFDPMADPDFVPDRGNVAKGVQAGRDAMLHIALAKGYTPIASMTYNLVFVENESAGKVTGQAVIPSRNGNGHAKKEPVASPSSNLVRLNIGAGDVSLEGYEVIDRKGGQEAYPLDRPDGSVDEIYASHILEHFPHGKTLDVLKDWARALKPGGVLKVAVPDLDWWVNAYLGGKGADLPLESFMFGGQADADDYHRAMFNEQKLASLLQMAGFGEIQRWKSQAKDCASMCLSLNLMGIKGAGAFPKLRGKVAACFSVPRFGPLDPMFCASATFTAMDIPAVRKSGVFWGACLQSVMEIQVAQGIPYILTMDYDTMHSPQDVWRLYRMMEEHPEADAICALQAGRDRATPLMTVEGDGGKNRAILTPEEMGRELLELRTGHFGLTMIRTASVANMPKPWFMHSPDKEGGWGDGRVDDDIYFWLKFREHGLRLFQANRIAVGHGEWMVTFPDQGLESKHQYISDYLANGKPDWVWR